MTALEIQIEAVLDELRPTIALDGGNIEFVSYTEGIVAVRLQGACASCALSAYTLKLGIETRLKESIPSITQVIAVE